MSRVWMITGAGRGLGRAFVQEAVNHGDKVIAAIRKVNPEDELFREENVQTVLMDVIRPDEITKAVVQGVTISSQSGWRMPQLTPEQDYGPLQPETK